MSGDEVERKVKRLARWLKEAEHAVALTGAGVSTESGIPDFRSPEGGLWNRVDPLKVASINGFLDDPGAFYRFWVWRFSKLTEAKPNLTHRVLAGLEERGWLEGIVTQNIDDLHRRAGSRNVYEVHGNYTRGICIECRRTYDIAEVFAKVERDGVPHCDGCGGLLKPDVVLFGELLAPAFGDGEVQVNQADLLWVLGSSLEVYPVADLVPQAKYSGARVALVNREETPFDDLADLVIHRELGPTVSRLGELLGLS